MLPAIGVPETFKDAWSCMEATVQELSSAETRQMTHAELEVRITERGRELQRLLLQGHLDQRARLEPIRESVMGSDRIERTHRREGVRPLRTVVGSVDVRRVAYGARGETSLMPADAELNLPDELYSHGLRELAAIEATRGSFEQAAEAIIRSTGVTVAKRQVEELVVRAAVDFDAFYAVQQATKRVATEAMLLVGTVDGKGIVMRREALRESTREAAEQATTKLDTRLSKGEKPHRKRMATVAAVYDVAPYVRDAKDVIAALRHDDDRELPPRPLVQNKRVWARLELTTEEVVAQMFDEMQSRDPEHKRTWVIVVDGANHQIDLVHREARRRRVVVRIVVDVIHAIEYLWGAAWCLFSEGDPNAEKWVFEHIEALLTGDPSQVAAGIRRSATKRAIPTDVRKPMDDCADYLLRKRMFMHYSVFLSRGMPIATGVIEGACRHLVRDRMDITGARWGLTRAEAVLRLRSLRSSGDFDDYWRFHLQQEHQRVHLNSYAEAA